MKKKNLNGTSKLQLLKETISPLTDNQTSSLYGGAPTNVPPTLTIRDKKIPPPPPPTIVTSGADCTNR